jgi:hypothetical protein
VNITIDEKDPDLKLFEQMLGQHIPEFIALAKAEQPSYNNPDFLKLNLSLLPTEKGVNERDNVDFNFALSLFTEDISVAYQQHCFDLINSTFSQVSDKKREQKLAYMFKGIENKLEVRYGKDSDGLSAKIISAVSQSKDKLTSQLEGLSQECRYLACLMHSHGLDEQNGVEDKERYHAFNTCSKRIIEHAVRLSNVSIEKLNQTSTFNITKHHMFGEMLYHIVELTEYFVEQAHKSWLKKHKIADAPLLTVPDDGLLILLYDYTEKTLKIQNKSTEKVTRPDEFIYNYYSSGTFKNYPIKQLFSDLFLKAMAYGILNEDSNLNHIQSQQTLAYRLLNSITYNNAYQTAEHKKLEERITSWKKCGAIADKAV